MRPSHLFIGASILGLVGLLGVQIPVSAKDVSPQHTVSIKQTAYHKHVTITFWSWVPGIQKTVAAFEKAYPTIHVNYHNEGAGTTEFDKLLTAIKAKQGAPDVVQISYSTLPQIAATGGLLNLSKYGASAYARQFEPWAWSITKVAGRVYEIPQGQGPLALAYNKTIFKKYGLTVPTTWSQYANDAKLLHEKAPSLDFSVEFNSGATSLYKALAWQLHGRVAKVVNGQWQFTVDSQPWQKVMSLVYTMTDKGWVPNISSTLETDHLYAADKVATELVAAWSPQLLEEEAPKSSGQWRIAPLPQWNPRLPASGNYGGAGDAITAQTKHPKASLLFAAWINTNPTAIKLNWDNGGIFTADVVGTHMSALTEPSPYFGGQRIGLVFAKMSSLIDEHYQYPPVMAYFGLEWPTLLSKAFANHSSLSATLKPLASDLTEYARTEGLLSAF